MRKALYLWFYLQSLLVQHKDFGVAFDPLHRKLLDLQARVQAEKGLQRDLSAKQVQLLRLQVRSGWHLVLCCLLGSAPFWRFGSITAGMTWSSLLILILGHLW